MDHQHARTTYTLIVEKPKPNFFEEGRTYRRFTKWSYRAEEVNATEYFTCTVVEQDGEGELVAFGRLAVEKPHRHDVNRWYLLHQYEWKNEGWEEVNVGKG
ncbi:hypothetical protein [Streptomyces sp. S1]|uniref:hypothetical protein n=1 Tax=Streptomyces sp. S1 TaxID=718288 RepID=UPI003D707E8C